MTWLLMTLLPSRLNRLQFLARIGLYFLALIPFYIVITFIPSQSIGLASVILLGLYWFIGIVLPRAYDCRWNYVIIPLLMVGLVARYFAVPGTLLLILIITLSLVFVSSRDEVAKE